jgi:uncharacterized protein (TIGR04255 family)
MLADWNVHGTQGDPIVFDLPPTPRYRLQQPPLLQVIAQVQFPFRAHLGSLEGIAPVQDQLDDRFPSMMPGQLQQFSLANGAEGTVTSGESTPLWNFTDDAGWSLVIAPGAATLSVDQRYQGAEDLSERFAAVLVALGTAGKVQRCSRLGVRFLNVALTLPGEPDAWRKWFRSDLVGWIGGEVLSSATTLIASITQTQLSARPIGELSGPPVDIQGVVRHGYVPPGTLVPGVPALPLERPGYLLDVDLFVDAPQPLDSSELSAQFGILHGQIDRFFRWALAPAGAEHFGLEEWP